MKKLTPIASIYGATEAETHTGLIEILKLSPAVALFDSYPDAACVSINDAVVISGRSRASIYRDHDAGRLPFVKFCKSTRIKVGDLRKYLTGGAK